MTLFNENTVDPEAYPNLHFGGTGDGRLQKIMEFITRCRSVQNAKQKIIKNMAFPPNKVIIDFQLTDVSLIPDGSIEMGGCIN